MKRIRLWARRGRTPASTVPNETEPSPTGPGSSGRSKAIRVRTLMILVASFGAIIWAPLAVMDWINPVDEWARRSRDGNAAERRDAVASLGTAEAGAISVAVPALAVAINDRDELVAVTAAGSLTEVAQAADRGKDPASARAAIDALGAALEDPRPAIRAVAIRGLGTTATDPRRVGEAVASSSNRAFLRALDDPDPLVRAAAAGAFSTLGLNREDPPEALLEALGRDPAPEVRAAAATALGSFRGGRDRTTVALLRAIRTADPLVRGACDRALTGIETPLGFVGPPRTATILPQLIEAVASDDPLVCDHAAAALGELGPDASPSIPALLAMLGRPFDLGATAITHGPPTGPARADPVKRGALALGAIAPGTPEEGQAVDALIALIRDPSADPYRRGAAAEGLGSFDPTVIAPALPMLLEVMQETRESGGPPTPQICFAIGNAAPALSPPDEAIGALTAALGWIDTKIEAANALAKFGGRARSALPRLRQLEADAEVPEWVREAASKAIPAIEGTPIAPGDGG